MRTHLFIISVVNLLVLVGCRSGGVKNDDQRERVILEADSIHEGWYFGAGDLVVIDGTVNGDAYIAGGTIDVDGKINGDLLVAGGNITVDGTVSDDIRVAGGNVTLSGDVGKNVSAAGGNVYITSDAHINGNVLSAGGNIDIDGTIEKEAKAAGGEMQVRGFIGKDAEFAGGSLDILPGSQIAGNVNVAIGDSENVHIAAGTVGGSVKRSPCAERGCAENKIIGISPPVFWLRTLILGTLLFTGIILSFLYPKQLNRVGAIIGETPVETIIWGFVGIVVIPVACLILFISLIGIPLGLLLGGLYLGGLYLSQLGLGTFLGQRMFVAKENKDWRLVGVVASGTLIVQIFTFVPILGFVVIFISAMLGMGAIMKVMREEYLALR